MLLKKCTHVLSPRGMLFTEDTIDSVLHLRYISARERRNGNYIKGPKKFQDKDRHHFITALEKYCRIMQEILKFILNKF